MAAGGGEGTRVGGCEVISATSWDPRHPMAAIVDGDAKTYWVSTGLFPQEVVLRLPGKASLTRLRIVGTSMRHIKVERSDGAGPTGWQPYLECGTCFANWCG